MIRVHFTCCFLNVASRKFKILSGSRHIPCAPLWPNHFGEMLVANTSQHTLGPALLVALSSLFNPHNDLRGRSFYFSSKLYIITVENREDTEACAGFPACS